ncbi:hypothetical protein [Deinococcus sp. UYEF24]
MTPKFRFGNRTIIRVAAIIAFASDGTATKPVAGTFQTLCRGNSIEVGLENGTMDIENFCTNGRTVSVRDGTQTGTLGGFDAMTWTEDDPALMAMEAAAFSTVENGGAMWVQVMPLGMGVGKPVYDIQIDVRKWTLKAPSKGVVTVDHEVYVQEGPAKGLQAA